MTRQQLAQALDGRCYDIVLPRFDGFHVDTYRPIDLDAVFAAPPSDPGGACACDQRLGRSAAIVDAGPTKMFPFNQGDLLALLSQANGKEGSRLASANYDRVKVFYHAVLSYVGSREHRYAISSIKSLLPFKSTVSPARAPSISSKMGAIVEIPMISWPSHVNLAVETAMMK